MRTCSIPYFAPHSLMAAALMLAAPAVGVVAGSTPAVAQFDAGIGLDIRIGYAPPPLPIYAQPPLPGPDYIWIPGSWVWSDDIDDYTWVEGYWVLPPQQDLLWTPAWWGWDDGAYRFHQGYWGREVGWYGGIDYGYGYHGHGWDGGRWDNGHVAYNRAVINISNTRVTNVYYAPVRVNSGRRVSYNGGPNGVRAQPGPGQIQAMRGPHFAPTQFQQQRVQQAAANPRAAASHIVPAWNPPPVHRVGDNGAPIPHMAGPGGGNALHGGLMGGAQPAYQRPNAPAGAYSRQGQGNQQPPYGNQFYARQPGAFGQPQYGQHQPGNPAPSPVQHGQPAPAANQALRFQPQSRPAPGYSGGYPQVTRGSTPANPAQNYARPPQAQYHPAQPQFQPQPQFRAQPQFHPEAQPQPQPQFHPQAQLQPQFHPQAQPHPQPPQQPRPQPQPHPEPRRDEQKHP